MKAFLLHAIIATELFLVSGCAGPGLYVRDVEQEAMRLPPGAPRADLYAALRLKTGSNYVRRELSERQTQAPVPYALFLAETPWWKDVFSLDDINFTPPDVLTRAAYIEGISVKEGAHGNGFVFVVYDDATNYIGFVSAKPSWSK